MNPINRVDPVNPTQISKLTPTPIQANVPVRPVNIKPVPPTLIPGTRYSFTIPNYPENLIFKGIFKEKNMNIPYKYTFENVEEYNQNGDLQKK